MPPFADLMNHGFPAGLFAQAEQNFWLPEQASSFSPAVDNVFYFILEISVFFFCLIVVLMVAFARRTSCQKLVALNRAAMCT